MPSPAQQATVITVKHAHPLGRVSERPLFPKMRSYDTGSCDGCGDEHKTWRCVEGCGFDFCDACGLMDENSKRMVRRLIPADLPSHRESNWLNVGLRTSLRAEFPRCTSSSHGPLPCPLRLQGGNSPLLCAATGGHLECVTALLAVGMDTEEANFVRKQQHRSSVAQSRAHWRLSPCFGMKRPRSRRGLARPRNTRRLCRCALLWQTDCYSRPLSFIICRRLATRPSPLQRGTGKWMWSKLLSKSERCVRPRPRFPATSEREWQQGATRLIQSQ